MADDFRRERDTFAHYLEIVTRWSDNDVYGHVNNALYSAFFDTAINSYLISEGGLDVRESATIGLAVETHCRYRRPIAFPDEVEVGLRVGHLGTSSVRYELAIFTARDEHAAAEGYFVHVFVDRATRRPVPIAGRLRSALERLLRAPDGGESSGAG